MKLDHTFIAIRERGILDICDLSLHVIRDHAKPLLVLLFLGAMPWVLIDFWLTGWLIFGDEYREYRPMYYWLMMLLVISQSQLGTTWLTYYLGQAMFVGRPGVWETIKGSMKTSPWYLWVHGGVRLVVPVVFLVWLTRTSDEDTLMGLGIFLVPCLVGTTLLIRAFRPFVSEILLLEKTPIKRRRADQIVFKRRSSSLHGMTGGDLLGRGFTVGLFLPLVAFSLFAMFASLDNILNLRVSEEFSFAPWYWLVALWLTAGFAAVIRFLSYIDIRIRQEGWAVELKMRAQGQRLVRQEVR